MTITLNIDDIRPRLSLFRPTAALPLLLALGACGDGSTGGVSFVPPPPPPPPAEPAGELPQLLSIDETQDLTVIGLDGADGGVGVQFDADLGAYIVSLPEGEQGAFFAMTSDPDYWSGHLVQPTDTSTATNEYISFWRMEGSHYSGLSYAYTGDTGVMVAIGMATPEGAVPVTGSATYDFMISGDLGGNGEMQFDFDAGTLGGWAEPIYNTGWDGISLGVYDFVDTVFGVGSTGFSGTMYNAESEMEGSFAGLFTGPGAEEAMGLMTFNYVDYYSEQLTSTPALFVGLRR